MPRMRRALGILPLTALLLAACARGTGAGADDGSAASGSTAAAASATAAASTGATATVGRTDIGEVVGDPAAYEGQEITILGRVDAVLADGQAFTTSPSGDENDILVVVAAGANVEKDISERAVVFVTGTVVPFTGDDLAAIGATLGVDELADYQGDYAIVATAVRDPLSPGS